MAERSVTDETQVTWKMIKMDFNVIIMSQRQPCDQI